MGKIAVFSGIALVALGLGASEAKADNITVQVGPRPYYLVDDMDEGKLKDSLKQCKVSSFKPSDFSIGHRGASMQFPEHTKESYLAAARMGAGIIECDVTFTKDLQLVCRHSQCDLHTTTNILDTPLASKCSESFSPADAATGKKASAKCCTSDITLAEFKTLKGKMDAENEKATNLKEYMNATPSWRTDRYASTGTLMTHAESIELFKSLGVKMTPELKAPSVTMPFNGTYTQEQYAQQMIEEYKKAGVKPSSVFAQSFEYADILYWIKKNPEFGKQAVFLDETFDLKDNYAKDIAELDGFVKDGVKIVAPPLFALVSVDANQKLVPSAYAKALKKRGLGIITWSLERSGLLKDGGGWYYQTIKDVTNNDGDTYTLLDVLAKDVGVIGVFSDWAATTTYYANCKGLVK
ncbi:MULTISPECIES: glycerophosphodiester phosphodiesterase family protein [unclassified Sulfurospirillum]|uniref:glycerophosphodiester phosphodiesterase family protein n=1 Tax=unclassified Sulfurospirillum TaxID=2618290 RepID=UPI000505096F|nr:MULTISPECIES: glycerophosphodiester phosphodiesterase family protein [unclassified Sulfurospirillum]KFL33732.1 glycerophosphodiester phosphodiesterase [Sulfurospirillum sp. SCADC]